MVRQGVTEAPPKTPFILGFECAGVVAAVADDVENFKVKPNPTRSSFGYNRSTMRI